MPKRQEKSNVPEWLKRETAHKRKALENASKHFDKDDSLTVNTLEAIYGQESSFGVKRRSRDIDGAAGDFHLEKKTAKEMGLTVSKKNDERFDIDQASWASAKYLKRIDNSFGKETRVIGKIKTLAVRNPNERKKFVVASFNAGLKSIAKAQSLVMNAGKDPAKLSNVQGYLKQAGVSESKVKEIINYVNKILQYEAEFFRKSKADKKAKTEPSEPKPGAGDGHWIIKDERHILIEE